MLGRGSGRPAQVPEPTNGFTEPLVRQRQAETYEPFAILAETVAWHRDEARLVNQLAGVIRRTIAPRYPGPGVVGGVKGGKIKKPLGLGQEDVPPHGVNRADAFRERAGML